MSRLMRFQTICLVAVAFVISGCARTEGDWKDAKHANTVSAYVAFMAKHPQGPHVDEAMTGLTDLSHLR